jgi:hypothetical protein
MPGGSCANSCACRNSRSSWSRVRADASRTGTAWVGARLDHRIRGPTRPGPSGNSSSPAWPCHWPMAQRQAACSCAASAMAGGNIDHQLPRKRRTTSAARPGDRCVRRAGRLADIFFFVYLIPKWARRVRDAPATELASRPEQKTASKPEQPARQDANIQAPPRGRWVKNACPGRGAAFFTLRRRAGTQFAAWAPALQRTTPQERRAALRPGHESA